MNYYRPMEVTDPGTGAPTGKWRYCCETRVGAYAVGYCSAFRNCPACNGVVTNPYDQEPGPDDCAACKGAGCFPVPDAERCRHDTKEEAYAHQKQYELDHARYHAGSKAQNPPALYPCRVCGQFTAGFAEYGPGRMSHVQLCDAHCNREHLEPLVEVGDRCSSY